ncbi:MAG TPA: TFIIB-type zinc ribbon-containing protein, partial [Myxococcales bacterium]|nr:TFIIB-type zinc ribbon-containing protein [Myxococcales bacterium]
MAAAELLCPECGVPYEQGDFQCTSCELILDLDAAEANYRLNEPSIVRALLSPPQRRSGVRPAPPATLKKKGDPEMTVRATVVMDDLTIPRLVAGMDLALTPLHEFEAMVASFVDGTNNVPQIATAAEISKVEAMAVFTSLAQRRIVELHRIEPPRPAAIAPPPPAPVKDPRLEPKTEPGLAATIPDPEFQEPPPPPPPPPRARAPLPTDLPSRAPTRTPAQTPTVARPDPRPDLPTPRGLPSFATQKAGLQVTPVRTPVATPPPISGKPRPSQLQDHGLQGGVPKAESVLERAISLERRGEVDGAIHILKRA